MKPDLAEQHCHACRDDEPSLSLQQVKELQAQLATPWRVINDSRLQRVFTFDTFMDAMVFINDIAAIAEEENHHPDMCIYYNRVVIELTTHEVEGLTDNDFILARKIEVCC